MVRFELRDPAAARAFADLGCPTWSDPFRGWCGVTACDMYLDVIPRHLTMVVGADARWVLARLPTAKHEPERRTIIVSGAQDSTVLRVVYFPMENGKSLQSWAKQQHFNAEALLVTPDLKRVIDPLGYEQSVAERRLIALHDPGEIFYDHPLAMVRAALFAARHHFIIPHELQWAMEVNAEHIAQANRRALTRCLEDIVGAKWGCAGLGILAKTGVLEKIVGNSEAWAHLRGRLATGSALATQFVGQLNVKLKFRALIKGARPETARYLLREVFGLSRNYAESILHLPAG